MPEPLACGDHALNTTPERILPGWDEPISGCKHLAELPTNAQRYVEAIERLAGCPIWLVSVGPDREQTIMIRNPLATA